MGEQREGGSETRSWNEQMSFQFDKTKRYQICAEFDVKSDTISASSKNRGMTENKVRKVVKWKEQ